MSNVSYEQIRVEKKDPRVKPVDDNVIVVLDTTIYKYHVIPVLWLDQRILCGNLHVQDFRVSPENDIYLTPETDMTNTY